MTNRADPGDNTSVRVHATSTALEPSERTFSTREAFWTTDGGTTWHPVKVHGKRGGSFRFTVPGEELATGTWVGLRFHAVDKGGNCIEQTLLRAFSVR